MPKRARDKESFEYFHKKLKKLESDLKKSRQKRRRIIESLSSSSPSSRDPSPVPRNQQDGTKRALEVMSSPSRAPSDDAADPLDRDYGDSTEPTDQRPSTSATANIDDAGPSPAEPLETSPAEDTLDNILLEILGENPSNTEEYGPDIQKDLASRFDHLATTGLDPKLRKELTSKYLVPANCTRIAAPMLNAEIKAALPEAMLKRDKSLEARQKQLATAIASLSSAMTDQLNSKQINQDLLKKLMDTARLLCDIQYTDSKTRRNYAMYSVKKDMKEHLSNTKQDKFLFGENLSETLKAAKAVNKSSTDLKVPPPKPKKPAMQTTSKPPSKHLNWKAPASGRRTPGPPRSREPATRRAPPATSSRQSSPPPKGTRRR